MQFPSLADMMDHRPLDQLHHCWQVATNYVEQHAQTPEEMREGKRRLKKELREFTTGESSSPCSSVSTFDDSPSNLPLTHGLSKRPAGYPPTILWTYYDYKTHCNASNQRIGSVPFAIRHADGQPISQTEWASIAAVVKYVEYDLLVIVKSRDASGKLFRRPDTSYYKSHHREQWDLTINKLESVCPILGLCVDHWKAEMVLRWALQDQRDPEDPRQMSSTRPDGQVDPNGNSAQPSTTSSSTAVKRTRDLSIIDVYPSKKSSSNVASLAKAFDMNHPTPPAPVHTASTSTLNAATQPNSPTHTPKYDMRRFTLQQKLKTRYKADLYQLVTRLQLANVTRRTLKPDLVTIIVNAALADKALELEVDQTLFATSGRNT